MTTEAVTVSYQDNTHSCTYIAVNMHLKLLYACIVFAPIFVVYQLYPCIVSSALEVCPNNHGCSHGCAIVNHTEQCFCPSGYALQNITQCNGRLSTCVCRCQWFQMTDILHFLKIELLVFIDIDECSMFSPCEQVCSNTVGSFKCLCRPGFVLQNDNTLCEGK